MSESVFGNDGRTILIVDDVPANLAVAVDYLEANHFQVLVAQDGMEGIERAQLVHPDLILLDVMMPGIDGLETCRRLKTDARTLDIPVIFMTALSDTSDKVAGFAAGAVDYISKPFQIEELLARVKTHLTLRSAMQRVEAQNVELRASATRYRRLFETAKDGILLLDSESGRVTDVNSSVVQMLGYGRDHFLNKKLCDVVPFTVIPACRSGLAALQTSQAVAYDHWSLQAKDKSLVDVEFVGSTYQVDGSKIAQCNLRDITGRKHAEARIHHMAMHDALTGLPNRVLLQDRLMQAIALARRNHTNIAVLMLDLDRFKQVNDSLGHHLGDLLLEEVSGRIKGCLRESDIVARLGGDEFVIVLPSVWSQQDIEEAVHTLLNSIHNSFLIEDHEIQITGSIGVAQFPADGENSGDLLRAADVAMYTAKSNGRNTHCFFTPELDVATQRRVALMNDLHNASAQGEFVIYYQPQVATGSRSIVGVEALLRWNHPVRGTISSGEFIPLLEEAGLIVEVGTWVLKNACLQNVAWQQEGLPPIRVSVNVSAQQFYRSNLVECVEEALRESQLDPKWLDLELTETLTLDDSETTLNIMHQLKSLGVSLSLDDFGTGWSSLSCLRRFPLDRIKIDRSFMRDILSESAAKAVVSSILDLAHNLGFSCIAEGVETEKQLEYLEKKKCPEIQGFLYSPALPALACSALMRLGKPGFATAATAEEIDNVA